MMYQTIGNRPTIYKLYADKLIKEGTVTEEQTKQLWNKHFNRVSEAHAETAK